MRWMTMSVTCLLALGCHVATGLDEIVPGERADDDGAGGEPAGQGGAGGSAVASGGGSATSTGASTSASAGAGADPGDYLGPAAGAYMFASTLAGEAGPAFYAVVTESSGAHVAFTLQALDAETREPVGSSTSYEDVPHSAAGTTEIAVGTLVVPAAANPLGPVGVVAEDVVLEFLRNDFPCGTLRGQVTAPIVQSLAGSTFFLTPVDGPTNLPLSPPTSCP